MCLQWLKVEWLSGLDPVFPWPKALHLGMSNLPVKYCIRNNMGVFFPVDLASLTPDFP